MTLNKEIPFSINEIINKSQLNYLINQALRSEEKHKHGAIVLDKKGNIISSGYNRKIKYYNHKFTIHAEVDAINKLKKNKIGDLTLIVVRVVTKQKILALSKPCNSCDDYIRKKNVSMVYYSC
jgi:deoxycytidylate deaminase